MSMARRTSPGRERDPVAEKEFADRLARYYGKDRDPVRQDPARVVDEARAMMRDLASKVSQVRQETQGIEHAQATKERYWKERDARQTEFFAKNPNASHGDFSKVEKPFADEAKRAMGAGGRAVERAVGRAERSEGMSVQIGERGGRYIVTASGEKHYVGNNEHHDAAQTRGNGPWQR